MLGWMVDRLLNWDILGSFVSGVRDNQSTDPVSYSSTSYCGRQNDLCNAPPALVLATVSWYGQGHGSEAPKPERMLSS